MTSVKSVGTVDAVSRVAMASLDGVGSWSIMATNNSFVLSFAATFNGLFGNVIKGLNLFAPRRVTSYYTALLVSEIARNCQFDKTVNAECVKGTTIEAMLVLQWLRGRIS